MLLVLYSVLFRHIAEMELRVMPKFVMALILDQVASHIRMQAAQRSVLLSHIVVMVLREKMKFVMV